MSSCKIGDSLYTENKLFSQLLRILLLLTWFYSKSVILKREVADSRGRNFKALRKKVSQGCNWVEFVCKYIIIRNVQICCCSVIVFTANVQFSIG